MNNDDAEAVRLLRRHYGGVDAPSSPVCCRCSPEAMELMVDGTQPWAVPFDPHPSADSEGCPHRTLVAHAGVPARLSGPRVSRPRSWNRIAFCVQPRCSGRFSSVKRPANVSAQGGTRDSNPAWGRSLVLDSRRSCAEAWSLSASPVAQSAARPSRCGSGGRTLRALPERLALTRAATPGAMGRAVVGAWALRRGPAQPAAPPAKPPATNGWRLAGSLRQTRLPKLQGKRPIVAIPSLEAAGGAIPYPN